MLMRGRPPDGDDFNSSSGQPRAGFQDVQATFNSLGSRTDGGGRFDEECS
eukprot:CAMPEP_0177327634 /NCGR_PEP_ID=MMETSP0368-20130122/18999_1 /TAXON_ID=447022 ORGANISM="Scrippsiella hangoei-like, Strain SHHI-4" /NCGR_SAMPLE_ID=MMETSP0368 /ASSEMBLY_ACC=CAM_ASM_000363 /LENGTH=49 /DNA_ID= /DNA_START= /DNA_END= /DNA_ORIENTATION=